MEGPYPIDEASKAGPYIGVYLLSSDGEAVEYVGRSDTDLGREIRQTATSRFTGIEYFWCEYSSSEMQAYKRECELYHEYEPHLNEVHPAVPPGTSWRCPDPDCEWASLGGLKAAKYDVPRLAEGKYLKLLYELFDRAGLLAVDERGLRTRFCPSCELKAMCVREDTDAKLSPLCLDEVATAVLAGDA